MITTRINKTVDLGALIAKYKEKYKNIYIFQFEDNVFLYHAIGRKDYRDLIIDDKTDELDKEEILCSRCVLYPENFDFANAEEAGMVTKLAEEIIKNSYVSQEDRSKVLAYFRNEMFDVDNQINCLILSAFPTLNLEEVEQWPVTEACKYLSRAEWILHNVNGLPFKEVASDPSTAYTVNGNEQFAYDKSPVTEEITDDIIQSTAPKNKVDHYGNPKPEGKEESKPMTIEEYRKNKKRNKQVMTPEKLRELQAKYPEIDWSHDAVAMYGADALKGIDVDTTPAALRTKGYK